MECSYCKHSVEKGIKACPYCGTLNPTQNTKEALVWTVGMILFFGVVYYLFN